VFKKGDKVLCIRGSTDDLIQGTTYTILRYHHEDNSEKVIVQESKYSWLSSRFILLTPLTEALV
jgi:hypothetical protein